MIVLISTRETGARSFIGTQKQNGGLSWHFLPHYMSIILCKKAAILSPIQELWGKSKTFYKLQKLEMSHTSRRFSVIRQGSLEFKGIWELSYRLTGNES